MFPASFSRVPLILLSMLMVVGFAVHAWAAEDTPETIALQSPVRARIVLPTSPRPVTGVIVSHSATAFQFKLDTTNEIADIQWNELPAEEVYRLHSVILPRDDAQGWINAGKLLLTMDEGKAQAQKAFQQAIHIKPEVEKNVKKLIEKHDAKLRQMKAEQDGRFFSSERVALPQPVLLVLDGEIRKRHRLFVAAYDHKRFLIDRAKSDQVFRAMADDEDCITWKEFGPRRSEQLLQLLLKDKPAQSWVNAGAMLYGWGKADDAADRLFGKALQLDSEAQSAIKEAKDKVDRKRRSVARRNKAAHQAEQKKALTAKEAKVLAPQQITIKLRSGEELTIKPTRFNNEGFEYKSEKETKRIKWEDCKAESVSALFEELIDEDNAPGWMRAGQMLLGMPEGEDFAKSAFETAYAANPKLKEPILDIYEEHRTHKLAKEKQEKIGRLVKKDSNPVDLKTDFSDKPTKTQPKDTADRTDPVRWVADFDCALQHKPKQLSPTRFEVTLPADRQNNGYFLIKLENVKDRTVQIEFVSRRAERNWGTLNPVFSYSDDLGDPANYQMVSGGKLIKSASGVELPATESAPKRNTLGKTESTGWHYITKTWEEGDRVCLRQSFTEDTVYVAMRVPYTPKLCDALMRDLQQRWQAQAKRRAAKAPDWEVVQVGQSREGRPLWLVQFGEVFERDPDQEPFAPPQKRSKKPCIVFYAREHADEHDTSWVTQGVIEYLLSDDRDARLIRQQFNVIVIPMLDPDGVAADVYERITHTFHQDDKTPESVAWAGFFKRWVDQGNRLDVVFNLHNVESGESSHLACARYEPKGARYDDCQALHEQFILPMLRESSFGVDQRPWGTGWSRKRLGGHLHHYYGVLHMPYEVNSQAPDRHLSLAEVKAVGAYLTVAAAQYLRSYAARPLIANINHRRNYRADLWEYWQPDTTGTYGEPYAWENKIRLKPHPRLLTNTRRDQQQSLENTGNNQP